MNTTTIIFLRAASLMLFLLVASACDNKETSKKNDASASATATKQEYFCPMHPQVRSDKPSVCSICQMDLVLPGEDDHDHSHESGGAADEALLSLDARKQALADVRLIRIEQEPFVESARAAGVLSVAESLQRVIVARASGRVERLFARQTGEKIRKGQALYEIYSPTLIQAQSDFLLALKSAAQSALQETQSPSLQTAHGALGEEQMQRFAAKARERLSLLGFSDAQINALAQRGEPETRVTVYAPFAGTVVRKNILEGASIQEGATLFEIADFSVVWNIAEVYERDASILRVGDEATVVVGSYPNERFRGKITLIYPTLTPENRAVKARIEIPNPHGRLRPGMFTETTFQRASQNLAAAMIPEESVVWNGAQAIVWVKEREFEGKSVFRAQAVQLGARAQNGKYPVLAGAKVGDEIAASGGFLMDSERLLRGGSVAPVQAGAPSTQAESLPAATIQAVNRIIAVYDEWTEALTQSSVSLAREKASRLKEIVAQERRHLASAPPNAKSVWEKFRVAVDTEIQSEKGGRNREEPPEAAMLETLRRKYEIISNELTTLRKHVPGATPLYRAYCPMAFDDRGAYWLTPRKSIRNPYFGEEMLRCGEIKEEITQ